MKTYYAPDLTEWMLRIPCGKASVWFHFTKGSVMECRWDVATYSTDNPAAIAIIENSIYFKRGQIRLARDTSNYVKTIFPPFEPKLTEEDYALEKTMSETPDVEYVPLFSPKGDGTYYFSSSQLDNYENDKYDNPETIKLPKVRKKKRPDKPLPGFAPICLSPMPEVPKGLISARKTTKRKSAATKTTKRQSSEDTLTKTAISASLIKKKESLNNRHMPWQDNRPTDTFANSPP